MQNLVRMALVIGAVFCATASPAQTVATDVAPTTAAGRPAYLRLGLGTTYDIVGYYRCARVSLEYAPMLSRQIGLASRIVGVSGKPSHKELESQLPNQNYKAAYLEQEVVFYPFGNDKRVNVGVGAGGFAGYYHRNSFNNFQSVSGKVTDYKLASQQGFHGGYMFLLNLDVVLGQRQQWRLGAKSTIQSGKNGNTTTPTHNLTLARRLSR